MPAKDQYHNVVLRALKKEGWQIIKEQFVLGVYERRLYVDIFARRGTDELALIEVKGFEDSNSPMTTLANTVGQYLLYKTALDYLGSAVPLYLAIPYAVYESLFTEVLASHLSRHAEIKFVLFDPIDEKITKWIP